MQSFTDSFRPANNRLHIVRHVAAVAVVIDHGFILSGHPHALSYVGFKISLGLLGVATFFVISGALISASFLHSRSWRDFLWRRLLRIYPAYITCLIVTALVIGPVASRLVVGNADDTMPDYWSTNPAPLGYVVNNSLLVQFQNRIGNLFAGHPQSYSVNGSLWSIPWEAGCYLMVFALGILGVLKRYPTFVLLMVAGAYAHFLIFPDGSVAGRYYLQGRITLLPIYFLSGAAFYLYRDKIPRQRWLGIASLTSFFAMGFIHWPTAAIILPYCIFWLAHREQPEQTKYPDFSYGIYIYGFPLQQLLIGQAGIWTLGTYLTASVLLVLPPAVLSWYLIEQPCLSLKNIGLRFGGEPNLALSMPNADDAEQS